MIKAQRMRWVEYWREREKKQYIQDFGGKSEGK
jgi:hypothetical protein